MNHTKKQYNELYKKLNNEPYKEQYKKLNNELYKKLNNEAYKKQYKKQHKKQYKKQYAKVHCIPVFLQQLVIGLVVSVHRVQVGSPQHPDVQVSVSHPVHSLAHVLNAPQHNLRIEHVSEACHHLTLYGQLLVHQGQIVLQFRVVCNQDTLALHT